MKAKRIIVAQGPMQLLNVLSVLRSQATSGEYTNSDDYLLLGGFCGVDLTEVCLRISSIWDFKNALSCIDLERDFLNRSISFENAVTTLKSSFDVDGVDAVYVCRNWQFINELTLSAFPSSRKICFGDGLGELDLNSISCGFPPVQPHSKDGYVPIDTCYLIAPHDAGISFDLAPFSLVDPEFFSSVVGDSVLQIPGLPEFTKAISAEKQPVSVALPSNGTEAGLFASIELELYSYLLCLLKHSSPRERILVKGHPRQTLNQSQLLVKILTEHSIEAIAVPQQFISIPIELICYYLDINKVYSFFSSSCVSLTYLYETKVILGFGEEILRTCMKQGKVENCLLGEQILSIQLKQALLKAFSPLRANEILNDISSSHENSIAVDR